ncbi:MAG: UvrD-helicase domain-containing protein [Acetobacteraceae bacterium]
MLRGTGQALPEHPAVHWARALDQPAGPLSRRDPPAPRPALIHRPRHLRVTEIETWLRDPYAIYARPRARPAGPEAAGGTGGRGRLRRDRPCRHRPLPAGRRHRLPAGRPRAPPGRHGFRPGRAGSAPGPRRLVGAPALRRIAAWVAQAERDRRLGQGLLRIGSEKAGDWVLSSTPPFTLRGRADRIERRFDGSIAILDYKTGAVPNAKAVEAGLAPQLPLEAAMAADGAFGLELAGQACELTYWHLTGGFVPGEVATPVQAGRRRDRVGRRHRPREAGRPGRRLRRPGASLSLAAAPRRRAAFLGLHPTRPRGRVGGAGGRRVSTASVRAAARQLEASDPRVSAFVAASAGSGKTKLLIDRLLRLMMAGADPARIQCLTFTKAAAAEMAVRLQKRLGRWVTLPDSDLDAELTELGIDPRPARQPPAPCSPRVLDLPGGMRIGTIHAFCQSLLRRFPLEAALAPHFRLLDDADGHAELEGARADAIAQADPAALAGLAGLVTDAGFGKLVAELRPHVSRLRPLLDLPTPALLARLERALGVWGDDAGLIQAAVAWPEEAAFTTALHALRQGGTAGERDMAGEMLGWLNLPPDLRAEHWAEWLRLMLTGAGERRKLGGFCKGKWSKAHPEIGPACMAECERVWRVEDSRRALRVAEATAALLTLTAPVLAGFEARKQRSGLLDYDDLIARTSALLLDPGTAWVLFKLDGGLDHLLLDEVQDTAPAQWEIAGALTAEFFAGEAAREGARTVFAVGDRKQSIYSFQGADPAGFDRWRERMRERVEASDGVFRDTALDVSFRSTAPVLALVDAVFADPVAASGVAPPGTLRHEAGPRGPCRPGGAVAAGAGPAAGHARALGRGGPQPRPDLRPAAPGGRVGALDRSPDRPCPAGKPRPAAGGGRRAGAGPSPQRFRPCPGPAAERAGRGGGRARPAVPDRPARGAGPAGPLRHAAAAAGRPLARLRADQPLGDLTDDDLMALAIGRSGSLWNALRARASERPEWRRAWIFVSTLLARADYGTPHALLSEALGPMGARARLLRRLGPEAAEPIDELLTAALAHAAAHPASLQGFVHWLRQSGAEVKRQAEEAGGAVRIMTVHGAKGLQAPLVILPDTTALPPDGGGLVWTPDGLPLWSPPRRTALRGGGRHAGRRQAGAHGGIQPSAVRRLDPRRGLAGGLRLGDPAHSAGRELVRHGGPRHAGAWRRRGAAGRCRRAMGRRAARHSSEQRVAPRPDPAPDAAPEASIPGWAGDAPDWQPAPLPAEPVRPAPVAPSRPAEADLGTVPDAASPLAAGGSGALERGTLIHRLLQHMPAVAPDERAAAVRAHVARSGGPDVAEEVLAVLAHPDLAAPVRPGRARRGAADRAGGWRGSVRPGGPARRAARGGADRRLQNQPPGPSGGRGTRRCSICGRWRPIAPSCAASFRTGRCAASWSGRARPALCPCLTPCWTAMLPASLIERSVTPSRSLAAPWPHRRRR